MLAGASGALVSGDFIERLLHVRFKDQLGERERRQAAARLLRWWRSVEAACGPATSVRLLVDVAARPLAAALGFEVVRDEAIAP
ncbi:MAG TPA: hypothetical protein VNK41_08590, partial [Vicinamibacterales bacterium]|nr:hypothetical protein [Vicinamibacterales bacterium]